MEMANDITIIKHVITPPIKLADCEALCKNETKTKLPTGTAKATALAGPAMSTTWHPSSLSDMA